MRWGVVKFEVMAGIGGSGEEGTVRTKNAWLLWENERERSTVLGGWEEAYLEIAIARAG